MVSYKQAIYIPVFLLWEIKLHEVDFAFVT